MFVLNSGDRPSVVISEERFFGSLWAWCSELALVLDLCRVQRNSCGTLGRWQLQTDSAVHHVSSGRKDSVRRRSPFSSQSESATLHAPAVLEELVEFRLPWLSFSLVLYWVLLLSTIYPIIFAIVLPLGKYKYDNPNTTGWSALADLSVTCVLPKTFLAPLLGV
jgi:hypothetical protein